jgi:succinate dehydrogenase/fumarate reductase-like Fe-S protein
MANETVRFIVKRQATPDAKPQWEEFDLRFRPDMNVIIALRDIAEKPVDRFGNSTTPVAYESNCLEEVCGSCAMLVNGKAVMACSALLHKLQKPIRLEPLSRFPVIRDLVVDPACYLRTSNESRLGYRWTALTIQDRDQESILEHRKKHIRCRAVSPAACVWRSAPR